MNESRVTIEQSAMNHWSVWVTNTALGKLGHLGTAHCRS